MLRNLGVSQDAIDALAAGCSTSQAMWRVKERRRFVPSSNCASCRNSPSRSVRSHKARSSRRNPAAQWTPRERAALRYAEQVTSDARRVGDELWAELKQHFDDGEIIELTAATTLFNMFNRFNDALQVDVTQPGWPTE